MENKRSKLIRTRACFVILSSSSPFQPMIDLLSLLKIKLACYFFSFFTLKADIFCMDGTAISNLSPKEGQFKSYEIVRVNLFNFFG